MRININDALYQQLSDHSRHIHLDIEQLIEKEMTKLLNKKHNPQQVPRQELKNIGFAKNSLKIIGDIVAPVTGEWTV